LSARVPRSPGSTHLVDALIWDYDGTLVDTYAADQAAVAELIGQDPAAAPGAAVFWSLEGRPLIERVERAWPDRVAEVLAQFDRELPPRLFGGIAEVLTEVLRRGHRMAVVSSRRLAPLRRGLRDCGLLPMFATVVGLESVRVPKPDPEGLLLALAAIDAAAARAVYIGDQAIDAQAARAAGMLSWTATWSGRVHPGFEPAVALTQPGEVLDRLDAIAAQRGDPGLPPLAAAG
jgi:phosphoglycolate phosphatase-like HAD superfamily hydrolase